MLSVFRSAAAAFGLAALIAAAPAAGQQTVTLRLVQTNDIDRMEEDKGRGGMARFAAVVKAERAKGNAIVIHAGDTLSPSLLSGFDKGAHMIDLFNRIGLDVFTPGNHEFDAGPENFRKRIAEARFDVIATNLRERDGRPVAGAKDDKMLEVEGVKIGFFGLTTEDAPIVSSPGDIAFRSSIDTARAKAKDLRARGADLVVAVAHTPLAVDMLLVRSGGADVVISGHDEHLLAFHDGRTVLTESGAQANHVVVTELAVTRIVKDGKASVTWTPHFRIVDTATVTPEPDIEAAVKGFLARLDSELDIAAGTVTTPLDSRRATVRAQEAAIGNLIADAMRAATGADLALTNGGGIRADRQYPAGATLARRDIFAEMPFGNRTVLLEISGAGIKAALENGFSQVRELGGRFPQVSGAVIEAELKEPPGSRVKSVLVNGQPLDPARTYRLATNDFLARGGDGYTAFVAAKRLVDEAAGQIMAGQVIDYVAKAGTVSPKVEGRIVLR